MNKKELLHIISQGESEQVEFKENFGKQVIETIVAFANTKGGNIFIGVKDNNQISGIMLNSETLQNWNNQIKLSTEPSVFPDIELLETENKTIAYITVNEFPVKPISVKGKYYKRIKNSNHLLSINEINDIYLKSMQLSWDSYPHSNSKYEDLDEEKIIQFIQRVNQNGRFKLLGTPIECLTKLKLIDNNIPTNAAMILFAKEEMYYNVHVGRFKTASLIIDDKMIRGNLFEVVEKTMQFIVGHIKVAFEFTNKIQRTEIFEYPIPAIKELVLNSIVHKDYTSPTDIQIKIFDNKITIFNPGKLFGGLTIEDLKTDNYQAQSRNKLITEAFYLTKDIEKYGSGYRRVREHISDYPTMYFNFEESSGGYLVTIGYKKQKISNIKKLEDFTEDFTEEKRVIKIIELIKTNNKITTSEIAKILNVTRRTIASDIKVLKQENKVKRIGSDKFGHWEIIKPK